MFITADEVIVNIVLGCAGISLSPEQFEVVMSLKDEVKSRIKELS